VGEVNTDSDAVGIVGIGLVRFASAYTPVLSLDTVESCVSIGPPRDGGVRIKGDDDDAAEFVECVAVGGRLELGVLGRDWNEGAPTFVFTGTLPMLFVPV